MAARGVNISSGRLSIFTPFIHLSSLYTFNPAIYGLYCTPGIWRIIPRASSSDNILIAHETMNRSIDLDYPYPVLGEITSRGGLAIGDKYVKSLPIPIYIGNWILRAPVMEYNEMRTFFILSRSSHYLPIWIGEEEFPLRRTLF